MNKPIHIHHIVLSLEPGGLENGVVNIINGLDPDKFKSSVCCLKTKGAFVERISAANVSVDCMNMTKGEEYGLIFKLAALLKKSGTDIVHTRNQKAFFYGFMAGKLAGVTGIIHSEHGRNFPGKKHRMLLQGLCSRFTDENIAMSADLMRALHQYAYIPRQKMRVIYNGVSFERFEGKSKKALRDALGIGDEVFVVGSVGRLAEVKNYPLLCRAFAHLSGQRPSLLMLVGDGPQRGELEALVQTLGIADKTRFLGFRDDVENLLPAMDLFALPSFSEGISNTLLEAMACGIPIVASAVGGTVEILEHKKTGLLFPSDDESALFSNIKTVFDNKLLAEKLAASAKSRALQHFSLPRMIEEYAELYESVYRRSSREK